MKRDKLLHFDVRAIFANVPGRRMRVLGVDAEDIVAGAPQARLATLHLGGAQPMGTIIDLRVRIPF